MAIAAEFPSPKTAMRRASIIDRAALSRAFSSSMLSVLLSDTDMSFIRFLKISKQLSLFLISLLMVAFNLFANGLRDALDPTKRGEE